MGSITGWVSNTASSTVNVVKESVDEVVDTADEALDSATETVTETASTVYGGVSEFIDSPPPIISGLFNHLNDVRTTALDIGENALKAGISAANDAYQTAGDIARAGPNAALDVAEGALSNLEGIVPEGSTAHDILEGAQNAVDAGQRALEFHNKAQEFVGGAAEGLARNAVGLGRKAAEDPVGTTKKIIEFVKQSTALLAIEDDIEDLGPGDSYTLDASLDGSVYGVAGRLEGSQKITKNEDGSYTLAVTGQAGVGLMSRTGTTGTGQLTADAFANQSGTVEFNFDSPEEVAEAARTFFGPIGGGISGALDGGIDGAIEGAKPDYDSLLENVSAVEISPSISGGVLAEVGFGGKKPSKDGAESKAFLGINAGVSGEAAVGARIEFPDDGPPKLILRQSVEVNVANSASIPGLKVNAGGGAKVTVEESFELPEGFSIGDAISDPLNAAKEIASNARRTGEVSVTLGAQVNGGVKSKGGQLEAELKFTGGIDDVLDSGAIEAAVRGDFSKAYQSLDGITQVEASLTPVRVDSTQISASGGDSLDSASISIGGTTVDRQEPIFEYEGTADKLAQEIRKYRFAGIRG